MKVHPIRLSSKLSVWLSHIRIGSHHLHLGEKRILQISNLAATLLYILTWFNQYWKYGFMHPGLIFCYTVHITYTAVCNAACKGHAWGPYIHGGHVGVNRYRTLYGMPPVSVFSESRTVKAVQSSNQLVLVFGIAIYDTCCLYPQSRSRRGPCSHMT